MEFVLIILGIIALVIAYFCAGMLIKFLWGWMPLVFGLLIGATVGILGGWIGAGLGVLIVILSIGGTNSWQDTAVYTRFETVLEKTFYFRD